jgi:hypothetical protein
LALKVRGFGGGAILRRTTNPSTEEQSSGQVGASSLGLARASIAVVGRNRGQVLVRTSRESFVPHGTGCFGVRQGPGVPTASASSEAKAVKVHEGRVREAGLAAPEDHSGEAEKPMRVSARVDSGPYAGTDLRREQSLGAAGHRDLLVLRARERDVMNSMRATAPKAHGSAGGKRSGG